MWHPIETAPKDGSAILIVDMKATRPQADIVSWGYIGRGEMSWRCGDSEVWTENATTCASLLGFYDNPTHWMPLPQPPEAE